LLKELGFLVGEVAGVVLVSGLFLRMDLEAVLCIQVAREGNSGV
jgi:hypothetical protein